MPSDDHWDSRRAFDRDVDREPTYARPRRARPQLTAYGTLRAAHEAAQPNRPLCLAGATSRDGTSLALCVLVEGHAGPHLFPKIGGGK